jgi:hypothetical protein
MKKQQNSYTVIVMVDNVKKDKATYNRMKAELFYADDFADCEKKVLERFKRYTNCTILQIIINI